MPSLRLTGQTRPPPLTTAKNLMVALTMRREEPLVLGLVPWVVLGLVPWVVLGLVPWVDQTGQVGLEEG